MQSMERKITIIPKKEKIDIDTSTGLFKKKRVCAYARVSTDLEDQKNSFNAQLEEYSTRIKQNPEWEFVELYSDEGISGTSIKKREGFQRMINDALEGKIDLILTKSISRFARNTVDCLSIVRELRKKNVNVWFEKENISTEDQSIELALTLFASMAQEESKSISENVKWGIRKRMQRGVTHVRTDNLLGFDKDADDKIIINEEEAEVVRIVYNLYIAGYSYKKIIEHLEKEGYKNGKKQSTWTYSNISRILVDEKYSGQVILQKTVTQDFLSHKQLKNNGLEQQYIITDHHLGIVTKEEYEYVQMLRKRNAESPFPRMETFSSPLSGIFFCRDCKRQMVKISTHPNSPYMRNVFTCKNTSKSNVNYIKCEAKNTIDYDLAMTACADVFNELFVKKNELKKLIVNCYNSKERASIYMTKACKIKNDITILETSLKELVKKQMKCESLDRFEKEFKVVKSKIESKQNELKRLEDTEYSSLQNQRMVDEINEYIKTKKEIPYFGFRYLIKAVIKTDEEIVFIVNNEATANIDIFAEFDNYITIYKNSLKRKKYSLNYRVVTLGGHNL